MRLERVGVDDRRHRIGGVVKAVDELKSQRDQQGDCQQKIGHRRGGVRRFANRSPSSCEAAQPMPPTRTIPKMIIGILPCFLFIF